MNQVNKTLYIPLYGKAFVSKKNTFFHDPKAEEMWQKEGFKLKGKSKSKWLAYDMAMRAKVFDEWTIKHIHNNSIVLHLGCGMDSRYERIGMNCIWYDIDFEEVIQERRKYFKETDSYHMIATDIRQNDWLKKIPKNKDAIIIMEGISMYLTNEELKQLFQSFTQHFNQIHLLIDCYNTFAAKLSKYKNPIQDVGVTTVYGIDDPKRMTCPKMYYLCEHELTPKKYIDKLEAIEKIIFKHLFSGKLAKSMYRLYEYQKDNE